MLSNTAVPIYYGKFREKVLKGEIPVCRELSLEMNRIDKLIAEPAIYYDDQAVEGWIRFCEAELTLSDGSPVHMMESFKLWGEQVFGWYYFVKRRVYQPDENGGHYVLKTVKKRLINKQYLIVARGAAKSMYGSFIQSYFLIVDPTTTSQMTLAPTMAQTDGVVTPMRTALVRKPGPLVQFLTEGSVYNSKNGTLKAKLYSVKGGVQIDTCGFLYSPLRMLINSILMVSPLPFRTVPSELIATMSQSSCFEAPCSIAPTTSSRTSPESHSSTVVIFGL